MLNINQVAHHIADVMHKQDQRTNAPVVVHPARRHADNCAAMVDEHLRVVVARGRNEDEPQERVGMVAKLHHVVGSDSARHLVKRISLVTIHRCASSTQNGWEPVFVLHKVPAHRCDDNEVEEFEAAHGEAIQSVVVVALFCRQNQLPERTGGAEDAHTAETEG